jgi:hypothetical protein
MMVASQPLSSIKVGLTKFSDHWAATQLVPSLKPGSLLGTGSLPYRVMERWVPQNTSKYFSMALEQSR